MIMNEHERIAREAEFHDRRFEGGDQIRQAANKYYTATDTAKQRYRECIKAKCSNARLLEYGCGTGSEFSTWELAGSNVVGIDISEQAVQIARADALKSNLAAQFHVMNAEALSFPNCSFDLVVGTGILHHLSLHSAYSEIARVLRPGGEAIFFEPLGHNPLINLYRRMTPSMRTPDEHPLLISDLELARQYFSSVVTEYFVLTTLLAVPFRNVRWGRTVHALLTKIDAFLMSRLPFLKKYCWIVIVRMAK